MTDPRIYANLTAAELDAMPTLTQGQADDLKIEDDGVRVWLSRVGVEDGVPFDDMVTLEELIDGTWTTTYIWPAPAPGAVAIPLPVEEQ